MTPGPLRLEAASPEGSSAEWAGRIMCFYCTVWIVFALLHCSMRCCNPSISCLGRTLIYHVVTVIMHFTVAFSHEPLENPSCSRTVLPGFLRKEVVCSFSSTALVSHQTRMVPQRCSCWFSNLSLPEATLTLLTLFLLYMFWQQNYFIPLFSIHFQHTEIFY